MKIIEIPFCFYPDAVGGTEIYVEALSGYLRQQNVEVVIAAPYKQNASYLHKGLPVRRFEAAENIDDLKELYGEGGAKAAAEFGKILDEEKPDIAHMHAFTSAVSLRVARAAGKRHIPVVFTYHTPTVSCQRGTLMRWGKVVCDGRLRLNLCARCTLHGLGVPRGFADILSVIPCGIGNLLGYLKLSGGAWTALQMRSLVKMRHKVVRMLMEEVSHIVVLCRWSQDVLLHNDVPLNKITILRQGIYSESEGNTLTQTQQVPPADRPVKIAYIGRISPEKGIDIIIQALKKLPEVNMEAYIYGVIQNKESLVYLDKLKELAGSDRRIIFMEPVSNDKISEVLKDYHLLAVPSRWLETGPLVILEAFFAGVPVIGSNLGGIAELVRHEIDGLLVKYGSVRAWKEVLLRIARDRTLIARLKSGIKPPQKMSNVVLEMNGLYNRLISRQI